MIFSLIEDFSNLCVKNCFVRYYQNCAILLVQVLSIISLVIIIIESYNWTLKNCMTMLNKIPKGQLIWLNHLWDIQDQKCYVFLRRSVHTNRQTEIVRYGQTELPMICKKGKNTDFHMFINLCFRSLVPVKSESVHQKNHWSYNSSRTKAVTGEQILLEENSLNYLLCSVLTW